MGQIEFHCFRKCIFPGVDGAGNISAGNIDINSAGNIIWPHICIR